VDRKSGKAELTFLADFMFTAGPLYKVSLAFLEVEHFMGKTALYCASAIFLHVAIVLHNNSSFCAGTAPGGHNAADNRDRQRGCSRGNRQTNGRGWLCKVRPGLIHLAMPKS
jgi:hypothetical protein